MNAVRKLWEDEDGSPTVEFVLWMPVFVLVLALIVNATLLLHEQSRVWDIARDGARQRAIGTYVSDIAAETYLQSRLPNATDYRAKVVTSSNIVTAEIFVKPQAVILFGKSVVGAILGQGFVLKSSVHMAEEF